MYSVLLVFCQPLELAVCSNRGYPPGVGVVAKFIFVASTTFFSQEQSKKVKDVSDNNVCFLLFIF